MRDLLANRRLVIFWAGQSVSKLGDGIAPVAAAALALRYYGPGTGAARAGRPRCTPLRSTGRTRA